LHLGVSVTTSAGTLIGYREFGRQLGVSDTAVRKAVKSGRLSECVARDADGRPIGIADPELGRREWFARAGGAANPSANRRANRRSSQASAPPQGQAPATGTGDRAAPDSEPVAGSLVEAMTREKHWKAKQAELEFKRRTEELVSRHDVNNWITTMFTQCRSRILAIPSKCKAQIPGLTDAQIRTIDQLLREALTELADAAHEPPQTYQPAPPTSTSRRLRRVH
jgi:hypothetical protein